VTTAWFMTEREVEIADWIDENLEDSTYTMGRTCLNKRSMIVYLGSEMDRMLFQLRWT
jgi:hypothetical protein